MKDIDIMLDIETMGKGRKAVITAIGAVAFDLNSGEIIAEHYNNISIQSCLNAGLVVNGSTIEFWMNQPDEARLLMLDQPKPLKSALAEFSEFVNYIELVEKGHNPDMWGNGVTFDNMILRDAYDAVGFVYPIHYRNDMDVRTLVKLGKALGIKREDTPFEGIKHYAVDDCKHQIKYVCKIYKALGLADGNRS